MIYLIIVLLPILVALIYIQIQNNKRAKLKFIVGKRCNGKEIAHKPIIKHYMVGTRAWYYQFAKRVYGDFVKQDDLNTCMNLNFGECMEHLYPEEMKQDIIKEFMTVEHKTLGDLGIIDDNCYKNGSQVEFDASKPYMIVTGSRGIGKSVYSKFMSYYNKGVQYYSEQQLRNIDPDIVESAIRIIHIGRVD